ncbi:proprotein convertase subtilisin/kexin type 9 isoform X2 [Antennarius striatus]|uniref:proprotein convertase subtilisin/kexin type 9 isoform X2 n=1 Tax=Antennarius striatus TaxID=241820 RepID=UPI0035AEC246
MRRTSGWIVRVLCLCASLTASAPNYPEDDELILDLMGEERTGAEPGAEPGAQLIRCNKALRLPHVHYIEEDSAIFAQSSPWNLQRLLQPEGGTSENSKYRPPNDGRNTEVYLMDGSVHSSHREVEGRVVITDFNSVPEEEGVRIHRQASRCSRHGTHIVGVVSGSDSGVAPGAGVKLVRVLDCQGRGTVSGVLAGLEYVRAELLPRPVGAVVVLLPLVGAFSRALNAACRDAVAYGAVVVAAAGNHRDDACLYSPASEPEVLQGFNSNTPDGYVHTPLTVIYFVLQVITIGAINSADQLMSQGAGGSNYGRCVDLFAPGDDIVSASSDCSTCFTSSSGTSQAAAHAAGIASVMLSSNQNMSPVQVLQMMLHHSIRNTIHFLSLSETHQLITPNLVAAMPSAYSSEAELLCRSVWSEMSRGEQVVSRCRLGEEMMSCSSYSPDGVPAGDTTTVNSRGMECVAHNGPEGKGVYAVARCCVIGGLQCQVHTSPTPGQEAECVGPQLHLSGCASRSSADFLSDSRPHHGDRKHCIVKDGSTSHAPSRHAPSRHAPSRHAPSRHAPSLECKVLEKISVDKDQVEVSCPTGWTLTDCKSISQGWALVGPGVTGNSCRFDRTTAAGITAGIAVCCHVRPPLH